jgi:uncharacterized protein
MKFLLLIAIVLVVAWLWRGNREDERDRPTAQRPAPPPPLQDMIQCPVCSVRLPRSDALPGPGGRLYCCAEHRTRDTG